MQVIEDMKECILRLGHSGKLLNVIDNQHINRLIKTDEIIEMVRAYGVGILHLEQMGRHIQHPLFRIQFFNTRTDSIDKMGFPHSRRSVQEQRVERTRRILGYSFHAGLSPALREPATR